MLACVLALLTRTPVRWFLVRLAPVVLVVVIFTLPLPFLLKGEVLWQWRSLIVTRRGIDMGLLVSTKAIALVTLMLVLLASAPLHVTLKAAQSLFFPRLLLHLLLLSYRYVFVLTDELLRLRIAVRVRGYRNRARQRNYRTIAHLMGTLLVRGSDRAERIHQAMRCRGFDGQFRSLVNFRTRWYDVVACLLLAGCATGVWILDHMR